MIRATDSIVERIIAFTTRMTTGRFSSRLTGRPETTECANEIREELERFCDRSDYQDFTVRPGGFLGFIRINIVLYFLILIAWFFHGYLLVMIMALLSMSITIFQFFLYWDYISFLFKKRTARNVWGVVEPTDEVRRQIYITAHHDSAHVFTFLQNNPQHYNLIVNGGLGISGLLIVLSIVSFGYFAAVGTPMPGYRTILWVFIGLSPVVLNLWRFYQSKGTPGAGDNMVCVATAIEIGKFFSLNRLKNTRVVIGSWDAEEAGLRGARAFLKEFGSEVKKVKTYNYNLECFYNIDHLHVQTSDLNGIVQLSKELSEDCVRIGRSLGYGQIHAASFPFLAGGTDAAEFAKCDIEATTLAGMSFVDKGPYPAYHTLRDTIEAVDPKVIAAAYEIGIGLVQDIDSASI